MNIKKNMTRTEAVAFKNARDAMRALQNNQLLNTDVREITNSTEYQALLKTLASLPRPFGIVIATPKVML